MHTTFLTRRTPELTSAHKLRIEGTQKLPPSFHLAARSGYACQMLSYASLVVAALLIGRTLYWGLVAYATIPLTDVFMFLIVYDLHAMVPLFQDWLLSLTVC
jgi:hypothetical protein